MLATWCEAGNDHGLNCDETSDQDQNQAGLEKEHNGLVNGQEG